MSLSNTPRTEIRVPGLDSEVSLAFPLEKLRLDLWGVITENRLQKLAQNVGGALVYPTAVYIGNQIVSLLPDMTGSIRTDDPNKIERAREFYGAPSSFDAGSVLGVAAYKIVKSSGVIETHGGRATEVFAE